MKLLMNTLLFLIFLTMMSARKLMKKDDSVHKAEASEVKLQEPPKYTVNHEMKIITGFGDLRKRSKRRRKRDAFSEYDDLNGSNEEMRPTSNWGHAYSNHANDLSSEYQDRGSSYGGWQHTPDRYNGWNSGNRFDSFEESGEVNYKGYDRPLTYYNHDPYSHHPAPGRYIHSSFAIFPTANKKYTVWVPRSRHSVFAFGEHGPHWGGPKGVWQWADDSARRILTRYPHSHGSRSYSSPYHYGDYSGYDW